MEEKEAIERIKARFDKWALDDEDMKAIQTLIPELKESEDERIIKTLQEYVKNRNWPLNGPTQDEVLAWLEKQEQKSKFKQISDSVIWDSGLRTGIELGKQKEQKDYNKLYEDIGKSEWFKKAYEGKSLGCDYEQKEQKPADLSEMMVHKEPYIAPVPTPIVADEQKPDWSDEDKEALDMCLDAIPKRWKTKSGILLTKWLKDNIHLQPKQEWGEEDESFLDSIEEAIHSYYDLNHAPQYDYWLEEKLKSLRPYWKPSKEQMKALKECGECKRCIKKLYEDLKKRYGTC